MAKDPELIREYKRQNQQKNREIDKALRTFRAWERIPGEPYKDFKKRLSSKKAET